MGCSACDRGVPVIMMCVSVEEWTSGRVGAVRATVCDVLDAVLRHVGVACGSGLSL